MAVTKRKITGSESTKFTKETLEAFAKDMASGRIPLERQQISDDRVVGLRAVIYKSGLVVFHVSYYAGKGEPDTKRPFIRIGTLNKDEPDHLTVEEARELARTIKALSDKGIDPQRGLHERLVKELKRDGVNWKLPK